MAKSMNQAADTEQKKTIIATVERAGEKIMIPEGMSIGDTILVLINKEKEEETVTAYSEDFTAFIWEGCYALARALDHLYGWFQGMTIPGSFFEPEIPPFFNSVQTGPGEAVQVPWRRFLLPHISKNDGYFETGFYRAQNGMICFRLTAQIRKKHSRHFEALCKEIRRQLKIESLYRGKAFTIKFLDSDGDPLKFPEPKFLDITALRAEQLIFSRKIEASLQANLYTTLVKTAQVRKAGIPLKRGILLAGPYGTGKTLLSTYVKELAITNGWTFLVCQTAAEFPQCVQFARQYQPAVVFCEDIDRATDGNRDEEMDNILNTIDGVDAKNTEIMLVLTTNEVDNIHRGMLRPGRLDAVIAIERPDAEAVGRLIRYYGGELLPADESLQEIGHLLAGNTPAVIREVVERAKLTAISLSDDPSVEVHLSEEALLISGATMRMHLDLLDRPEKRDPDPMVVFGEVVAAHLIQGAKHALTQAPSIVERFHGGALEAETHGVDNGLVRS